MTSITGVGGELVCLIRCQQHGNSNEPVTYNTQNLLIRAVIYDPGLGLT